MRGEESALTEQNGGPQEFSMQQILSVVNSGVGTRMKPKAKKELLLQLETLDRTRGGGGSGFAADSR